MTPSKYSVQYYAFNSFLRDVVNVVFIFLFRQRSKNKCTFIGQTVVYSYFCYVLFFWHVLCSQNLCLVMWYCNSEYIHGVTGKHWTVGSYWGGEKGKWHQPFYASFGKSHCTTYTTVTQKDFNCLSKSNGRMHVWHSILFW